MATKYFSIPSLGRAKKEGESSKDSTTKDEGISAESEREPLLNDAEEKFFQNEIELGPQAKAAKEVPTAVIMDSGDVRSAVTKEEQHASKSKDHSLVPELPSRAESHPTAAGSGEDGQDGDVVTKPATGGGTHAELPSQEEAEAMTKGFNEMMADPADEASNEKKSWKSYVPSIGSSAKRATSAGSPDQPTSTTGAPKDRSDKKTWKEYASSYVPSLPEWSSSKGMSSSAAYNEDGSINEDQTRENQQREMSSLLSHLNSSAINDRVFALNSETKKFYERFAQVLKDLINGVPTAHDDLEQFMREAGPKLEKQFSSLPPFVRGLVKKLPMSIAPELLAATTAAATPEEDLKAASEDSSKNEKDDRSKSKKKRTPGLKSLPSEQGAIVTMLRNTVSFLQTRFPFLACTTNVVVSLSVFSKSFSPTVCQSWSILLSANQWLVLMFVFWYCWKRGREVRLARDAEGKASEESSGVDTHDESEVEKSTGDLKGDESH